MRLHTKLSDPHRPFRDRDFAKVLAIVIVGICFLIAFAIYADAQELRAATGTLAPVNQASTVNGRGGVDGDTHAITGFRCQGEHALVGLGRQHHYSTGANPRTSKPVEAPVTARRVSGVAPAVEEGALGLCQARPDDEAVLEQTGAGSEPARVHSLFLTPLAIGFAGLAAGDVITTRLALRNPALVEGNPLYRGSALRMGLIKGGATAGLLMTALSVRHTHPKAALWMLVGFTAGQIVVDAHNWSLAR